MKARLLILESSLLVILLTAAFAAGFSVTLTDRRQILTLSLSTIFSGASERPTVALPTGVQYSDVRTGGGTAVGGVVLIHVRALLLDGSVLFDTHEDGGPILHKMNKDGMNPEFKNKVTPGLEEAIKDMRQGGVRLAVVPSAYGYDGMSRFDAYRAGLRKPVPRDEMIRYEVEALRCRESELDAAAGRSIDICCSESSFPCQADGTTNSN